MRGRQVRLVGKKMVINLNNKGGVRKSPSQTSAMVAYKSCVAGELEGKTPGTRAKQRELWRAATKKCKGSK